MKYLLILCLSSLSVTNSAFSQQKSGEKTKTTLAATRGNDNVFVYVEQMPEAPYNVSEYLSKALVYPKDAQAKNIEGRVLIKFVVRTTGKIDSVVVMKSVYPSLDSTALSVVKKMPKWKPGLNKGKPVDVYYTLPIKFTLK